MSLKASEALLERAESGDVDDAESPRGQLLNQSPLLRDC
jgi:hypothetical protein